MSGQPTGFSQLEEIDIDCRVSGLPLAVVKQAENFRVRELVKKIESHPHREALQADLQQSNGHNPFSDNSKAMIRKRSNVELSLFCETIPKVQCYHCLLYWNQGVIYYTCGNLLVECESSQKNSQFKTWCSLYPALRNKEYSETEAQKQYHITHNAWKRCRSRVDGQEEHHEGIQGCFLRDQVHRDSQLIIDWTETPKKQWYLSLWTNRTLMHRCDFDQISELQSQSRTVSTENQEKKLQPNSPQQNRRWHFSSSDSGWNWDPSNRWWSTWEVNNIFSLLQ